METLERVARVETRLHGFKVCVSRTTGFLTSLQMIVASKLGLGETITLEQVGPGSDRCKTQSLTSAVQSVKVHINGAVVGLTFKSEEGE